MLMRRWLAVVLATVAVLALVAGGAIAGQRVALVVGNGDYKNAPRLTNAINDAQDIASRLEALHFRVVKVLDADRTGLERAIRDFAAALKSADLGLFYYAGHGLQFAGRNYIVPTDAELSAPESLDFEMLPLELVQRAMEGAVATNVIIVDACRDSPLARRLARSLGTRSAQLGRGLAPVESGVGTLISFSTQPGNVALDGQGRNSPFAAALIKQLEAPRDDLVTLLTRVRKDVIDATGGRQVPWDASSLTAPIMLGDPGTPTSTSAPPAATPAPLEESIATSSTASGSTPAAAVGQARGECLKAGSVRVGTGKTCLEAGEVFNECGDSDWCPRMVVIAPGSFLMGASSGQPDERPVHKVTIRKAFAVGETELTFAQWDACVADGGCSGELSSGDEGWGRGNQPAVGIAWAGVKTYLDWLNKKLGLAGDQGYRLLSEAEWEYAARAGSTTAYSWGDKIGRDLANCDGCGSRWDNKRAAPVGSFQPNKFGLFDMHGNVWEWVEDCYLPDYSEGPATEAPRTTGDCSRHVQRGGATFFDPSYVTSAFRGYDAAEGRSGNVGARIARTLAP